MPVPSKSSVLGSGTVVVTLAELGATTIKATEKLKEPPLIVALGSRDPLPEIAMKVEPTPVPRLL